MEVTAVPLTSGDIFINDEGWIVDYFNPQDPNTALSWVETGEINEGGSTDYFWAYGLAYNTPDGVFMFYDLGPVAQSDLNAGNWIAYKVNRIRRRRPSGM